MHSRRGRLAAVTIALLGLVCCGTARAVEPAEAPATQPTAAPLDESVAKALVAELGSENPKTRTQAAAILRKMGKDALPALQAGVKDADPQVRASSQSLIDRIQNPEKFAPKPGTPGYALDGGERVRIVHRVPLRLEAGVNIVRIEHVGRRDIDVTEPGRTVRIHEDAAGIRMTVIAGGKPEQFQAPSADELKRTAPEAFKVYERYAR